ncbi:Zn-dependent hydrolase [Candidatus Saccharibacteria bacterium 32-50-10]|nr:MAG: Zn-dependent hydrolase [Candidatus Saccharibacteria bacterium 32-50-10]
MFDIEYKGANSVVLTSKKTRVVFDPRVSVAGGKDVSVNGDIEVLTEDRFAVEGASPRLMFHGPGEYEAGDVALIGIPARRHIDTVEQGNQATIYRVTIGGVRLAVLGNVASPLGDDQLESIGVVDMVVIPVGGNGYTLDGTDAAAMIRQIEPRAVIPVHYADSGLSYEVPQDDFEVFVKELGAGVVEAGPKFKVKGEASVPEQLTVIKISRS